MTIDEINEIEAAYNTAALGADTPGTMLFSPSGLRQFAQTLEEPRRSFMLQFAARCPKEHFIVLSRPYGLSYSNGTVWE